MNTANNYSIDGRKIEYKISYRNVKYPRLEFKTGNLLLVLPMGYKDDKNLIEKHKRWIASRIRMIEEAQSQSKSLHLEKRSDAEFKELVRSIVERNLELRGKIQNIYIRKMRTKWASYSSRNNLTINSLSRYLPKQLIEYIIFHETAHIEQKRHNSNFWRIVAKNFPDYATHEKRLLAYWFIINERLFSMGCFKST